jgi:wyosine [tRNA(Phe)-imidazoG37] synthetase (radical SAM superfamily)
MALLSTIKKYLTPSPTYKLVGIVLVRAGLTNRKTLRNRLLAIISQFNKAGVDKTVCVSVSPGDKWEQKLPGEFTWVSADRVGKMCNGWLVATSDAQFAVSSNVILKLLDSVKDHNFVSYTHDQTNLVYTMQLYGECLAGPASAIHTILKRLAVAGGHIPTAMDGLKSDGVVCKEYELGANDFLQIYKRIVGKILPVTITIETSNRCNQSCLFCPYHGNRQSNDWRYIQPGTETDMSISTFKRLVDEVSAWEDNYLDNVTRTIVPYLRGEPLLYNDFREACSYVKQKNMGLFFVTNASLLSHEISEFLVDIETNLIKISRHGITRKAAKGIRVNDNFTRVEKNIINLVNIRNKRNAKQPEIGLTCTINEENIHEQEEYLSFWRQYVDFVDFSPENYHCKDEKNKKFRNEFIFFDVDNTLRPPCRMLLDNLWILADGRMKACIGGIREDIGSVREKSILEALGESQLFSTLCQVHSTGTYKDHKLCNACETWKSYFSKTLESAHINTYLTPVMSHNVFVKHCNDTHRD